MLANKTLSSPNHPVNSTCYFSIRPRTTRDYTCPDETPLSSLSTPSDEDISCPKSTHSIAFQPHLDNPSTFKMDASRLLQLQTQAAHPMSLVRPQARPLQDVLYVEDSSERSPDSETSSPPTSSPSTARCSRCQRTLSFTMESARVSYGLNLYYCARCAEMVGYKR